jgi:hypothetical protein
MRYTLQNPAIPQRRSGCLPLLTTNQVDELIEFICSLKRERRIAFKNKPHEFGWDCIEWAIRSAFHCIDFKRYPTRWKSPITKYINVGEVGTWCSCPCKLVRSWPNLPVRQPRASMYLASDLNFGSSPFSFLPHACIPRGCFVKTFKSIEILIFVSPDLSPIDCD